MKKGGTHAMVEPAPEFGNTACGLPVMAISC
jgi:hypothetical protein